MSWATRCSACNIAFRVLPDQLNISDGWVRCGRCDTVFNARDGLFELNSQSPAEAPANKNEPAPQLRQDRSRSTSQPRESEDSDFADARFPDSIEDSSSSDTKPGPEGPLSQLLEAAEPPEFVRKAEKATAQRRPAYRLAWTFFGLVLLLGLFGQATFFWRDALAAQWPQARAAIGMACETLGCTISAPQRIEDIVLESSALTQTPSPRVLRLSLVLRNRGGWNLLPPAIDLALTDTSGRIVARRAVLPADFGSTDRVLAAGASVNWTAYFSTPGIGVLGYTVEAFYP